MQPSTPKVRIGKHRVNGEAPDFTPRQSAPTQQVDLERLAERIVEKLREMLALENERTGRS